MAHYIQDISYYKHFAQFFAFKVFMLVAKT